MGWKRFAIRGVLVLSIATVSLNWVKESHVAESDALAA